MTTLLPIDARIARADRAHEIVAPQYDSLARGGRYQYAIDRPDCFLNVVLSRADFPTVDMDETDIARRASDHFEGMLERGLFPAHGQRAFFIYELSTESHRQAGLVAGVPVQAIGDGKVLGHEGTIHDRTADLADFYRSARLSSSPVALTFDADDDQRELFERVIVRRPIRDFTAWDGVRQRLWSVDDPTDIGVIQQRMDRVGSYYVTDGHHRVAASQLEGAVPGWFLAVIFPADQMHVLEYNRCVALEEHHSVEDVIVGLGDGWVQEPLGPSGTVDPRPREVGELTMLVDGLWSRLRFVGERPDDPIRRLDVCLLHDQILEPGFGILDDQDPRLSFVVGEGAGSRLEEVVRSEPNTVAFALYPTSVEELFAVADAGRVMPAKSTWFTPKPRSGLIVVRW